MVGPQVVGASRYHPRTDHPQTYFSDLRTAVGFTWATAEPAMPIWRFDYFFAACASSSPSRILASAAMV